MYGDPTWVGAPVVRRNLSDRPKANDWKVSVDTVTVTTRVACAMHEAFAVQWVRLNTAVADNLCYLGVAPICSGHTLLQRGAGSAFRTVLRLA